jgi:hypothetical protein
MNPDSKTYRFRCLVSEKAGVESEPAPLPGQDAEHMINLNRAGNLFLHVYRHFWQKSPGGEIREIILADSNKESGISDGISSAIPAIFLNQLIENN